jgi:hypothetical protein
MGTAVQYEQAVMVCARPRRSLLDGAHDAAHHAAHVQALGVAVQVEIESKIEAKLYAVYHVLDSSA